MKRSILLVLLIFVISIQGNILDSLATKYQTDKRSGIHDYTKIYEKYFSDLQLKKLKILEIGFGSGCSAHMWEDYFCNSELHFIDINTEFFDKYGSTDRSFFHHVDQADTVELGNFAKKHGPFDIIIDDGSHQNIHQLVSFKALFSHLKKGGIYVIEDLHTAYWKSHGGYGDRYNPKAGIIMDFLSTLLHDVNYIGARTGLGDLKSKDALKLRNSLSEFQSHIESMHFYNSMCLIFKY